MMTTAENLKHPQSERFAEEVEEPYAVEMTFPLLENPQARKAFYSCYQCSEKFISLSAVFDQPKHFAKNKIEVSQRKRILGVLRNRNYILPAPSRQSTMKKKIKVFCPNCEYNTTQPLLLRCHIFLNHKDIKKYKCSTCIYKSQNENMMEEHSNVRNICDQTSQLMKHMTSYISATKFQRPFKCTLCGFIATSFANLIHHKNQYHSC